LSISDQVLKKVKFFEKTMTPSATLQTFIRSIDVAPLFARNIWLQIPAFDLTELGMGLLHNILPIDFEPLAIDFTFELPTPSEVAQGIWMKFEPVDFSALFTWMSDFRTYVLENFKEQFQPSILLGRVEKAVYGVTPYGRGAYDPQVARELLRASFMKLRLLRKPDISWLTTMDQTAELAQMVDVTDEHVFNRLMMMFAAQVGAFVLGLGVLGHSRLTETRNGWGVIPIQTVKGEILELHFTTLDQLQMGFILGVTPLGYGLLLPKESIYRLPDGKKNPPFIEAMTRKIIGIRGRLPLLSFAYANYSKPEEMTDPHKSQRTVQYDALQDIRIFIEEWVARAIPPEEANPITIRQYQNAVLQALSWRAKRHAWGYTAWQTMTEEEFRRWWLQNWVRQGLKESTLNTLYEGALVWLRRLREEKLSLGSQVKQERRQLSLLT